jgi:hypothetical protein
MPLWAVIGLYLGFLIGQEVIGTGIRVFIFIWSDFDVRVFFTLHWVSSMCHPAFHHSNELYLRKTDQRRERRFISAHSFRGFSPWLIGPFAFGPVVRQHIMAGAHSRAELFTSWLGTNWRGRGGAGSHCLLKCTAPMTRRPPTMPHF